MTRRLTLAREPLAELTPSDLTAVAGGATVPTRYCTDWDCPTLALPRCLSDLLCY